MTKHCRTMRGSDQFGQSIAHWGCLGGALPFQHYTARAPFWQGLPEPGRLKTRQDDHVGDPADWQRADKGNQKCFGHPWTTRWWCQKHPKAVLFFLFHIFHHSFHLSVPKPIVYVSSVEKISDQGELCAGRHRHQSRRTLCLHFGLHHGRGADSIHDGFPQA